MIGSDGTAIENELQPREMFARLEFLLDRDGPGLVGSRSDRNLNSHCPRAQPAEKKAVCTRGHCALATKTLSSQPTAIDRDDAAMHIV